MTLKRSAKYKVWLLASSILFIAGLTGMFIVINGIGSNVFFVVNNMETISLQLVTISFEDFIESLFCPLSHPLDTKKYFNMIRDIYQLQFTNDICQYSNNENEQYYIFEENKFSWGLFSALDNHHIIQFTLSLAMHRKFLLNPNGYYRYLPNSNGKSIPNQCQNRTGRQCYFKPVSNCNIKQIQRIIDNANRSNSLFIFDAEFCSKATYNYSINTLSKFINFTKNFKVIYYSKELRGPCQIFNEQTSMNKELTETIIKNNNYGDINYNEFNALIFSFLFRLQNNIKYKVNEIVSNALKTYNWTSSHQTIAMPVRASDKCIKSYTVKGEMKCTTIKDHMKAIYKLRNKFNGIDTVIITSEDSNIIMKYKILMRDTSDIKWVFNDFDILPNSGNPITMKHRFKHDLSYYKLFLSMLTSLKIQMHASYYILHTRSNWINGIWVIASSINCEIYDYQHYFDNDSISIDNGKHCINFDQNGKQLDIDKHCFREDRYKWTRAW